VGGTAGIAPGSLGVHRELIIDADSNLFALNGGINISRKLSILNVNLNIIDNPNDPTPHSITLLGGISGSGTINHLSHGDLIFAGTDDSFGRNTINTQTGYGRIVLNGNTAANIQMNGGEIAGTGGTRGNLTAQYGTIISPGYNDNVGTLFFRNVDLDLSTILNFKLSSTSDLIQVDGDLTVAGILNIRAETGFRTGTYTLFNYSGALIYNQGDLRIDFVPNGYDRSKFFVQTGVIAGQVNLLVPDPKPPPQDYYRSTDGSWGDITRWNPQEVPDSNQARVTLNNTGSGPLNLDLKGNKYTVNELEQIPFI
jgi:hypothetical protein